MVAQFLSRWTGNPQEIGGHLLNSSFGQPPKEAGSPVPAGPLRAFLCLNLFSCSPFAISNTSWVLSQNLPHDLPGIVDSPLIVLSIWAQLMSSSVHC